MADSMKKLQGIQLSWKLQILLREADWMRNTDVYIQKNLVLQWFHNLFQYLNQEDKKRLDISL
jgi:hypothetical protein